MSPTRADRPVIARAAILEAANSLRLLGTSASKSARLIGLLCDDRVGGDELCLRIERDPVLCARVLRVANSAFYAQQRTVTTIRRALLVLGLNAIRGIAAAACIDQVVPPRIVALPDPAALLHHSLATALACEMLAAARFPTLLAESFIAGLIHNLGVILQATVDPSGTAAMIAARRTEPQRPIRALESEYAGIRHEEAIGAVFDSWHLPPSLVAVALHHHGPDDAPEEHRPMVLLVGMGAELALACGSTYSLEPAGPEPGGLSPGLAALSEREMGEIRDRLPQRLGQLLAALR